MKDMMSNRSFALMWIGGVIGTPLFVVGFVEFLRWVSR